MLAINRTSLSDLPKISHDGLLGAHGKHGGDNCSPMSTDADLFSPFFSVTDDTSIHSSGAAKDTLVLCYGP